MTPPLETRQLPKESKATTPRSERYVGEIVYIYAFDVAYDMKREGVKMEKPEPADPLRFHGRYRTRTCDLTGVIRAF